MSACRCPQTPGRTITDPARHAAWHTLVVEQGGPAELVDLQALREARGPRAVSAPTETVVDERARASGKRASGKLREASR